MEDIEREKNTGDPESDHCYRVEPTAAAIVVVRRHSYAYESQKIQYLRHIKDAIKKHVRKY